VAPAWSRVDTCSFVVEKNIFTAVLDRNEGTLEESPALTFASQADLGRHERRHHRPDPEAP